MLKKGGLYLTNSQPAGRPEANSPINYRFKNISLRVPFWRLTGGIEVNFGPFSLRSSLRVRFVGLLVCRIVGLVGWLDGWFVWLVGLFGWLPCLVGFGWFWL